VIKEDVLSAHRTVHDPEVVQVGEDVGHRCPEAEHLAHLQGHAS